MIKSNIGTKGSILTYSRGGGWGEYSPPRPGKHGSTEGSGLLFLSTQEAEEKNRK